MSDTAPDELVKAFDAIWAKLDFAIPQRLLGEQHCWVWTNTSGKAAIDKLNLGKWEWVSLGDGAWKGRPA